MNSKLFLFIILTTVILSACNSDAKKIVAIRFAEDDTTTHVTFLISIITGNTTKMFITETPYTLEFTDQSYIVTAYPEADSVKLFMESRGNNVRSSGAKGWAHSGTIFYIKPNGGPGYMGNPK